MYSIRNVPTRPASHTSQPIVGCSEWVFADHLHTRPVFFELYHVFNYPILAYALYITPFSFSKFIFNKKILSLNFVFRELVVSLVVSVILCAWLSLLSMGSKWVSIWNFQRFLWVSMIFDGFQMTFQGFHGFQMFPIRRFQGRSHAATEFWTNGVFKLFESSFEMIICSIISWSFHMKVH